IPINLQPRAGRGGRGTNSGCSTMAGTSSRACCRRSMPRAATCCWRCTWSARAPSLRVSSRRSRGPRAAACACAWCSMPSAPWDSRAPIAGGAAGRLALSEARQRSVLANGVLRRIDCAATRAWIMSAYFVPSRRFRKALRRAARRGVDVRLLVPGARTDHPWVRQAARRFYGRMLRNGVKIFEYQPRMLHAEMILCDVWVSIGSSNLDRWSFRWNLEANQEIADARFADAAAALFERDFAVSRALSRRHWRQRAWLDRLREGIAGVLDRQLDRWR